MTYQTYEQLINTNTLVQCFVGSKSLLTGSSRPIAWRKPKLAKFITIIACAGGGGGGSGGRGTTGSVFGGGGGGSGGSHYIFVAAFNLPDVLYISAGFGGAGGTAGNSGSGGSHTLVSLDTKSYTSYSSHIIFTNPGGGGGNGTTGSGAGGTGGSLHTHYFGSLGGLRKVHTGITGRSGSTAAGNSFDFSSLLATNSDHVYGIFCGPGAGGGCIGTPVLSTYYGGGDIILGSHIGNRIGGPANSSLNGMDGLNAYLDLSLGIPKYYEKNIPLFFSGGAGGGSGTAGGKGGNGGYGSGGGGGGATDNNSTSWSVGGNGGPGLVIITSIL